MFFENESERVAVLCNLIEEFAAIFDPYFTAHVFNDVYDETGSVTQAALAVRASVEDARRLRASLVHKGAIIPAWG